MRVVFVLLAATALVPTASAFSAELDPVPGLLQPDGATVVTNATFRAPCDAVGDTVDVAVKGASFFRLGPDRTQLTFPACANGTERVLVVPVSVHALVVAPALKPGDVTVTGDLLAGNVTVANASASTTATARYFSVVSVGIPEGQARARPGSEVTFPLEVVHFTNDAGIIRFNLLDDTTRGVQVKFPARLLLPAPGRAATVSHDVVPVVVSVPEGSPLTNIEATVAVGVQAVNANNQSLLGDGLEVRLRVAVEGRWSTPAAPAVVAVAAVAAAAVIVGRRARNDD